MRKIYIKEKNKFDFIDKRIEKENKKCLLVIKNLNSIRDQNYRWDCFTFFKSR